MIKGLQAGGAERLVLTQASLRDRQNFEYSVAYVRPDLDLWEPELRATGVQVTCLQEFGEKTPWWIIRLHRLIAKQKYDIVHTHSPYVASVARIILACFPRSSRPRHVYTEHSLWSSHRRPTRWANRLTQFADSAAFAVSDKVRSSTSVAVQKRMRTLMHGIDLPAVRALSLEREASRRELGLLPTDFVIGTVANLRPQKAIHDLLRAARRVLDTLPDVRFVCIGQGPQVVDLQRLQHELTLQESFEFLGARPNATRYTAAFDIFALSSVHEGLPVAVMEALALGIPVVATAVGGLPEALRDGIDGLLVPPSSPMALANALVTLAEDRSRRDHMARSASERASLFDARHSVRCIEDAYLRVALKGR